MPTFILSTESLNSHGFWIKTKGLDLSQFKKNPVMYWMHQRPSRWDGKDQVLPIGRWENIRVEQLTAEHIKTHKLSKELEGTQALLADPVFDPNDEFAQKIASKVDGGFLRMCSLGVKPVELSSDKTLIKPGQRYETLTKGRVLEASIVDRGSNDDAVRLYEPDSETISLSEGPSKELIPNPIHNDEMKLTAKTLVLLKVADDASDAAIEQAIVALAAVADKVPALELQIKQLNEANVARELAAVKDMLEAPELKLTAEAKANYLELAEKDVELAQKLIKQLPKVQHLRDVPKGGNTPTGREGWTFGDWSKKDPDGLKELKASNPEQYKELYEAEYVAKK